MGKNDSQNQLIEAKRAYKSAKAEGNRSEEARWANVIGDILKNRGEYVEALRWLRIDYEISLNYLHEKQLLPSCQSLGEVYLRLHDYKHALTFQKKHLELAKDENDLVEQQRASTQLGRTYHEIFVKSEDDHDSVRNARKYFKLSLDLAKTLKKNLHSSRHSFVKEYIDAYNNIGMLEVDLDNLEEAEKILSKGLEISDEEEVSEDDDGRSRLHHNLGNVYTELRNWDKAREHIEKDITICHRIGHCQGEAKGYINLGELHYRVQKYDEAMQCYERALKLAKSMEDEDALISQANQNIEVVKQACKVMDEIKTGEQNLKKLAREMEIARGTEGERKCLLQQNSLLDRLIEKSSAIFAWKRHRTYAKKKKQIASELCDKEKLSDSFLAIGESHQKLREFDKALKWYNKSLDTYISIGNLEGQALAKINIGNVLDSNGNWGGALAAFEEGYRIAIQAKKPSIQLSALENMHYSQMIRFDNVEEARRLQLSIDKLKQSKIGDLEARYVAGDCCSESETEVGGQSPITSYDSISPKTTKFGFKKSKSNGSEDESEDLPLISLVRPTKNLAKLKSAYAETTIASPELPDSLSPSMLRPAGSQAVSRKRVRLVLSDDEENEDVYSSSRIISTPLEGEMSHCSRRTSHKCSVETVATSDEFKDRKHHCSPSHGLKEVSPVGSGCGVSACTPINLEESTCSDKSRTPELGLRDDKDLTYSSTKGSAPKFSFGACGRELDADVSGNNISDLTLHACGEHCQHILFRIGNNVVHVKWDSGNAGTSLSLEQMKVEVACLYYLQLRAEERSEGLVPVIQHMMHEGRVIESVEAVNLRNDNMAGKAYIDVTIDVWVPKHLMKLYIDCCEELSQPPILKVLKMLYNQEVSEDEIVVSDCELQDISVAPLINALYVHKTFAVLDLSHNLLGNGTMEKLKRVFTSSGQNYGGLTLDLHCNRLGSTALFQICECHVLYARLEVLNISGNRLTDACASYLSTILQNCKALYSLNIEQCSITSRTIQKVADSLTSGSALTHLSLGHNHSIAANAVINLLVTLTDLKRFQELSLKGIKLSKAVIESLCQLIKSSCLSGLLLGSTTIGPDGMLKLMQSLSTESQELKLDVSSCGLTPYCIVRLNAEVSVFNSIVELDLGGNQLKQEGGRALAAAVSNPRCCFRVLLLQKCQLGLLGILWILKGLSDNYYLEELNMAENADRDEIHALLHDPCSLNKYSNVFQTDANHLDHTSEGSAANAKEGYQEELCTMNTDNNLLEAPDSEDEQVEVDAIERATNQSCSGTSLKSHSNLESDYIQELSAAIQLAKHLQLLDLSDNGFTKQLAENLYTAWTSSSRSGSSRGHIEDNTIHLSVEGVKCCHLKPCCRRI
ncbi:protein TONSOKU isoform X2 [Lycium barbarum]|uniref:protein TONSOKU isoform X2 n=1 Tax=Lycium barbarum TaxID=112863 RepID=UPI00293E2574|nr:protein TONSOKU isoform X2 [Lycium barbarum]